MLPKWAAGRQRQSQQISQGDWGWGEMGQQIGERLILRRGSRGSRRGGGELILVVQKVNEL